jgi:hypothetical protein|tara:strand:+ start:5295 stop:5729 length:435 start_codon:yes stop_codon:yes gene_type:complete
MSTSLYDTFGNEIQYNVLQSTLTTFLENATIKFPLPQASSQILGDYAEDSVIHIDGNMLEQIQLRLEKLGFKKPNARALSVVLIKVAQQQGISPIDFFTINENTLNITKQAYEAINALRPDGSRVNLVTPKNNSKSPVNKLLKA